MNAKVFGTDGIRGTANEYPVTPDVMLRLGMAVSRVARRGNHRHQVLIGKDTRLSGYMIEQALTSGLVAGGMDVVAVGPVPTPAVGVLTSSLRADMGIMITASHNPFTDNGVKLFGPDGFKLPDQVEREVEVLLQAPLSELLAKGGEIGQLKHLDDARARYIEAAKRSFPRDLSLSGMKIAIDAANGAGYRTLPWALWELGADLVKLGVSPDGENINRDCGSLHPEALAKAVVEQGCDIGVALDGDGDRITLVDETGRIVDGDQILATLAMELRRNESLRGGGVVATIMSNLSLERFLDSEGLDLIRTKVGDRYVVARMRAEGFNLGGEQSGHIVLTDHATTGDGLVAALQVLAYMVRSGKRASQCLSLFEPYPQHMVNVRLSAPGDPLEHPRVREAIADTEASLGKTGRLVIRKSGTEPLVRVMVEASDAGVARQSAEDLASVVRAHL
jgi:phosphoglucosamine mutase